MCLWTQRTEFSRIKEAIQLHYVVCNPRAYHIENNSYANIYIGLNRAHESRRRIVL